MRFLKTLIAGALSLALFASPALSAGTIFGLGLSQQIGADRQPLEGALLYIYEAGTSTPVTVYEDFALSQELPFPIEADSAGRLPALWLEDGSYRVRLTTAAGVEVFDYNSITAIGPSSGTGGGAGGGVGDDEIFQTGDPICTFSSGVRSGWVRLNARTIGSSSSGATERANADVQALFEYLWANCSNTDCPVSTGRGASAAADWASNKTIGLPDMRGRTLFGHDTMGNSAAGVLTDADVIGESGGSEDTTSVPAHTHTGPAHTHTWSGFFATSSDGSHNHTTPNAGGTSGASSGGSARADASTATTSTDGNHSHTVSVSGTTSSSGTGDTGSTGDASVSLMNPYRVCTWYGKL